MCPIGSAAQMVASAALGLEIGDVATLDGYPVLGGILWALRVAPRLASRRRSTAAWAVPAAAVGCWMHLRPRIRRHRPQTGVGGATFLVQHTEPIPQRHTTSNPSLRTRRPSALGRRRCNVSRCTTSDGVGRVGDSSCSGSGGGGVCPSAA